MATTAATPGVTPQQPLTAAQQAALKKLHQAATGFEAMFLNEVFKAMRKGVSGSTLAGPQTPADQMYQSMLDEQRSQALAKTGSLGIASVIERQMRAAVLASVPTTGQIAGGKRS